MDEGYGGFLSAQLMVDGVSQHSHGVHGPKVLDAETLFCSHMKEPRYGGEVFRPDAKARRAKVDFFAGCGEQAHRAKLDFNAGNGGKVLCDSEVGVARLKGGNAPKLFNDVGNVSCAVTGLVGKVDGASKQADDAVSVLGRSRKGFDHMGGQRSYEAELRCEVDDGTKQAGDGICFVGCSRKELCDIGDQRNYEAELLRETCNDQKVFCEIANKGKYDLDAGCNTNGSRDMRDDENMVWTSPRISFSQDFTIDANEESKCSAVEEDAHLEDFEFIKDMPTSESVHETKGFMLSADKLFLNGKLLPLHRSLEDWGSSVCACDDLRLTRRVEQHKLSSHGTLHEKPTARHLSFDMGSSKSFVSSWSTASPLSSMLPLSYPSSCSTSSSSLSASSSSLSSSATSLLSLKHAPTSSGPSLAEPSLNPVNPKSQSKYSAKIKELFKAKKVSSSMDNTAASTCRLPISPRSFWPFSRSNSAGESKTVASAVVPIPRRSNSAGERIGAGAGPKQGHVAALEATTSCSNLSSVGVSMVSVCQDSCQQSSGQSSGTSSSSQNLGRPDQCRSKDSCPLEDVTQSAVMNGAMQSIRVHGFPGGRVARRKNIASTSNFARCSPGRRGLTNSPGVRINAGKIVLRNLERCSAEKKLRRDGLKGSGRRSLLYSGTTMRVTPVLNVAVYKGKTSQAGLLKFGGLFTKEKKPKGASLTNWRNGA